jgi:hypothetical protein
VVLAVVVDGLAGPRAGQDLERLVEPGRPDPVVGLLARAGELAGEPVGAEADAEGEPAAAEQVQRGRLTGQLRGPAPGDGRHHRAEPQSLGRRGDGREGDPRVGHPRHRLAPAEVVPDEHPGPARLLGLGRQPGDEAWVGEVVEDRKPECAVHEENVRYARTLIKAMDSDQGDQEC